MNRPTFRTRDRACDNCGRSLLAHEHQRYCPELSLVDLAIHLRKLIGFNLDIECIINDRKVGGECMLIRVHEEKGCLYADFSEGWGIQVVQDGLSIRVTEPDPGDKELFAECYRRGYYKGVELNERLQAMLT